MSGNIDQRAIPGGYVMAKAMHVTALAECTRRNGALAKTKLVPGIVFETAKEVHRGNGRSTTYVVADFYFGGSIIKRCKLTTRSVVSSECSDTHAELLRMMGNPARPHQDAPLDPEEQAGSERSQQSGYQEGRPNPPSAAPDPPPPPIVVAAEEEGRATAVRAAGDNPLRPSVTAHNTEWYKDDMIATQQDINGPVLRRDWCIRDSSGNLLGPHFEHRRQGGGCNNPELHMSRLEYFLIMFPPSHLLQDMARLTNKGLSAMSNEKTSVGELLKFFGILILASKFEFQSKRNLRATTAPAKYIPAPAFGRTGLPRMQFEDLWKCIHWSDQPSERPEGMTSEQYRWRLVNDFVAKFNEDRTASFQPSELICVDESISRDDMERAATG